MIISKNKRSTNLASGGIMRKKLSLGIFVLFLVLNIIGTLWADEEVPFPPPVMRPDQITLMQWQFDYDNAPRAYISPEIEFWLKQKDNLNEDTSMSLLSHLNYVPSQRNQGSCGNCWVWAGTGVMEVALDIQESTFDRLSIQYLDSCWSGWACCGGNLGGFASWYNAQGRTIPWSNINASFADGSRNCGHGSSLMTCGSIATFPNYLISSIASTTITTHYVTQAQAIANIKNVLHQNKAVYFSFGFPNATGWNDFYDFWYGWSGQTETTLCTMIDNYCGTTYNSNPNEGGYHAVLIVGYNDSDVNPANHYWITVNSWGTAGGTRPNGIFRIPMQIDYDCTYPISGGGSYWVFGAETLNVVFGTVVPTHTLNIQSTPDTGVNITVTPGGSGTTNFTRTYNQGTVVSLTAPATFNSRNFERWLLDGANYSTNLTTTVTMNANHTIVAHYSSAPVALCLALDNCNLVWVTGGSANWFGQTVRAYYGGDAGQSGAIIDSQNSYVQTTVSGPGELSFYWSVSSENSYDYLNFYINGILKTRISGEVSWQNKEFWIPAGTHALRWTYTKDASLSSGSDAGWLDYVRYAQQGFIHDGSWTSAGYGSDGWYIGDYNRDGRDDIFRYIAGTAGADVFTSNGTQFLHWGYWTMAGHGADGWHVGDYNGDGRDDIFRVVVGVSGADVFTSNGTKFLHWGSWTGSGCGSDGWHVGDFNGDGRDDIFRVVVSVSGADVFTSNGTKFLHWGSWTGSGCGSDGWYVGDFNGDGRDDIFRYLPGTSGADVFLSNGTKFYHSGSWTGAGHGSDGWYVGDYNGDGRDDIFRVLPGTSGADVFLSTGTSFMRSGSWTVAGCGPDGWHVGDYNRDGRDDIFRYVPGSSGADVFLNYFPSASMPPPVSDANILALDEDMMRDVHGLRETEMGYQNEEKFLAPFLERAMAGEEVSFYEIKKAYEKAVGHPVRMVTVRQLLHRHEFWNSEEDNRITEDIDKKIQK
jgi:hypothetical protein